MSLSSLVRYGVGQTGAQMFRDVPAVLLPLFLTTMLGVPPWMAGLAVLAPKAWVIVCDPMIGAWSDRLKPRIGRAPFLIAGALGSSLGFLALFQLHGLAQPWQTALAVSIIYLLSSTAFSAFSVPYLAIASELTPDPHERTRIFAYRMAFTVAGLVLGVGFAQPMMARLGGGADAWKTVTSLLALACLLSMGVTAVSFRGKGAAAASDAGNLAKRLRSAFANAPYRILLATFFIQSVSQACSYTVVGYIYLYVFQDVSVIPTFILVMSSGTLLAQPLWLFISRRWGKPGPFVAASVLWVGITLTWTAMHPATDVLARVPVLGVISTQYLLILLRGFAIGLVNSGFVLLAFSMLTDTIAFDQAGLPSAAQEGVYSGLFSAADKSAFAVGPVIAGVVLSFAGFKASTHGAVSQSPHAVLGVLMMYSVIPAVIQLASLAVFASYGRRMRAPPPSLSGRAELLASQP